VKQNPNCAPAYIMWGLALVAKNDLAGALPLVRKGMAMAPDPDAGQARVMAKSPVVMTGLLVLALAALKEGNAAEATDYLRRVQKMLPGGGTLVHRQVEKALRCYTLMARLSEAPLAPFEGEAAAMTAPELLEYGVESATSDYPGAALRCFDEAFRKDPKAGPRPVPLPKKLDYPITYDYLRAVAALFSGFGKGHGLAKLPEAERLRLRQSARDWFQAELAALEKQLAQDPAKTRAGADLLLGLNPKRSRYVEAFEKLPPDERQAWQQLWDGATALRDRAAADAEKKKKNTRLPNNGAPGAIGLTMLKLQIDQNLNP
jgi:hypothetical protein